MSTNTEIQSSRRILEVVKWIIVSLLLVLAIIGCPYYDIILPLRILVMVTLISLAIGVALLTKKGKEAVNFIKESRNEISKIIWPTRKEALQTTLIVIGVSSIISLVLWGLDNILIYLISFITSLRFENV